MNKILYIVLVFAINSCGVPGPIDKTFVYKSGGAILYRFKPLNIESYKGDTIFVEIIC